MVISERIKLIRGSKSQDIFAQEVGVSKMTVGRWERGERVPDADNLNKILESYPEINPTWLLTGEGEMGRRYVTITKETPKGFGRAMELTFNIYLDGFRSRLQKEMGGLDDKKPIWLSKESGIHIDKIIEFLTGKAIPTVDELMALAGALGVSEVWLAEGDLKQNNYVAGLVDSNKETISKYALNESGLDTDLIKYILAAVELISDDIGRDSDVFSVTDRIMVILKLYNTHIKQDMRPLVTLDRMIEQAMNTYFFNVSLDKLERLRSKLHNDTSNPLLKIVNTFIKLRHDSDKIDKEVARKQAEREKSRKKG